MFDLIITQLRGLDDAQLRELVARLCEAEVVTKQGGLRRTIRWGGAQTAPDGGLNVEVREGGIAGADFVPRAWTGLQVKKDAMPDAKIRNEVAPKRALGPIIQQIAEAGGAYVVITLNDGREGLKP